MKMQDLFNLPTLLASAFIGALIMSCGIPDNLALPVPPIPIDRDGSDQSLSFIAPSDSKIDRYILWYKIYPNTNDTERNNLIATDTNYFANNKVRTFSSIENRDYHRVQLGESQDRGYFLLGVSAGTSVILRLNPSNTSSDFIQMQVGGGTPQNIYRDIAVSSSNSNRKPFYGKYSRAIDADIKTRMATDFKNYSISDKSFAVNFLAQSAYVDADTLGTIFSEIVDLGFLAEANGFEDS